MKKLLLLISLLSLTPLFAIEKQQEFDLSLLEQCLSCHQYGSAIAFLEQNKDALLKEKDEKIQKHGRNDNSITRIFGSANLWCWCTGESIPVNLRKKSNNILKAFLDAGLDPNYSPTNKKSEHLYYWAYRDNNKKRMQLLKEYGAKTNTDGHHIL